MVHQITFIVTNIRATIAEIEKISFFHLPNDYADTVAKPKFVPKQSKEAGRRKSSIRSSRIGSHSDLSQRKSVQFNVVSLIRPCRDYFAKLNLVRNDREANMTKLFESIGPILVKLESVILGTHTGVSAKMKQYYTFWEKELFTLLIK